MAGGYWGGGLASCVKSHPKQINWPRYQVNKQNLWVFPVKASHHKMSCSDINLTERQTITMRAASNTRKSLSVLLNCVDLGKWADSVAAWERSNEIQEMSTHLDSTVHPPFFVHSICCIYVTNTLSVKMRIWQIGWEREMEWAFIDIKIVNRP